MSKFRRRTSRFFWKLFWGYAVLITVALGTCVLLIVREFEQFHVEELTENLRAQALAVRSQVRGRLNEAHTDELNRIANEIGGTEADGVRVTIVAAGGKVLGDSQADINQMDPHSDRPEIIDALAYEWGLSTRWSSTLSRQLRYVALRVGPRESPEGVVRLALAVGSIAARAGALRNIIWSIGGVALLATVLFALGLVRVWTLPLRRVTQIASRLSEGDLSARATVRGSDELARLALSLNEMRAHLGDQLRTIDGQRRTFEVLLDQLQEGVVVAGPEGKIVLCNPAAARLLHPDDPEKWDNETWVGQPLEQCVPQPELQQVLLPPTASEAEASGLTPPRGASALRATGQGEPRGEVRLEIPTKGGAVALLARASNIELPGGAHAGAELASAAGSRTGRVLALTDITEMARTIQMKTDFVANASHELRTPLSAIRAALETVLSMDLVQDAEPARRFLMVIDRHSGRLEALVADLLALSRLESVTREAKPDTVDLRRFCAELRERWLDSLCRRQLHWECVIPPELDEITADADLLRMVFDNLVDNAVKFTEPGGCIALTCVRLPGLVEMEVADNGCGIPAHDQERVFERFYQTEQARAGVGKSPPETRGTGLGLAIVRHAVASMDGSVTLQSELGVGTRVKVKIPQP